LALRLPALTRPGHSALAYYHDHKDEIASFADEEKAEAEHETKKATPAPETDPLCL
jgi:hypothetical protein